MCGSYTVAVSSVTGSVKCSPLEGNCSLTLNVALGPGGTFERLERPLLMGLHPGCQEAKAVGTDELHFQVPVFGAVGDCMLPKRGTFLFL